MRIVAAYLLIFYGVLTVVTVTGSVRRGHMAPGAGLTQALVGITMIFAALGVLLGLGLALAVAIASVAGASILAAYHAILLDGRRALRAQAPRTTFAVLIIAALLLG